MAAAILVLAGSIRLGDNSSVTKRVIERLASSSFVRAGSVTQHSSQPSVGVSK